MKPRSSIHFLPWVNVSCRLIVYQLYCNAMTFVSSLIVQVATTSVKGPDLRWNELRNSEHNLAVGLQSLKSVKVWASLLHYFTRPKVASGLYSIKSNNNLNQSISKIMSKKFTDTSIDHKTQSCYLRSPCTLTTVHFCSQLSKMKVSISKYRCPIHFWLGIGIEDSFEVGIDIEYWR